MSLMMFHTRGPLEKRALGKLSGTRSRRSHLPRGKGVTRWELQPRLCPGGRHVWLPEPKNRAEYSLCPRLTSVSSLESILGIPCFFCPPPPDEAEASCGPQKSPQSSLAAMVPTPLSLQQCHLLSAELWEEGDRAPPPPPSIAHCWGSAARG